MAEKITVIILSLPLALRFGGKPLEIRQGSFLGLEKGYDLRPPTAALRSINITPQRLETAGRATRPLESANDKQPRQCREEKQM